jgi:four helix bundle protein
MAIIERFEDIEVWKQSREFANAIYKVIENSERFSKEYRFKEQIKASSGSIMDNIAEGYERSGNKEFIQFLYVAKGSCGETRSQLCRAYDQGCIDETMFELLYKKAIQISSSIANFIKYLKQSEIKGSKFK